LIIQEPKFCFVKTQTNFYFMCMLSVSYMLVAVIIKPKELTLNSFSTVVTGSYCREIVGESKSQQTWKKWYITNLMRTACQIMMKFVKRHLQSY